MQLGANVSLMPPNVGVNKVFSDPAYQMMAQRMGMDPRTYWQTLQPQAQAQHLKRVNAGPAVYTNKDQIDFGNRIGANSSLAAIPEDAPTGAYPPVSAGYEGSPVAPKPALADAPPANVPGVLTAQQPTSRVPPALATPLTPDAAPSPDTSPAPNPNDAFVPVTLNPGTTSAAVFELNPKTGEIRPVGDVAAMMIGTNARREDRIRQQVIEAYNNGQKPGSQDLETASQNLTTATGILESAGPNPSYAASKTAADAIRNYNEAEAALAPDAAPPRERQVLSANQPYIDVPHALDQMEAEGLLSTTAPKPAVLTDRNILRAEDLFNGPVTNTPASPVLANSGTTNQPGALTDSGTGASSVASRTAAATSGNRSTPTNNTGNARGSGVPDLSVSKGDMWIRMGSAMLANSQNGLANALGAAGQAYSDVQDENKAYALKKYEMEQAKIEADRANAARSGGSGGSANTMTTQEANSELARMDEAIAALTSGGVTGPIEGSSLGQWWDRSGFGNTSDAAMRLILSDYAVNKQLAFTMQTKGAISDREMALFEKPIPKLTDSEEVWLAWFKPQREVLAQLSSQGYTAESPLGQQGSADTSGYIIEELPAQ